MFLNRFFNSQTKTISSAAIILAISALISRILGILRDWLLAKTFGAGPELDVYFAAFRIPDLVYNILIIGGFTVAFLPLFSEYFSKNKEEAWQFTNNVLNIFLFSLILLSFILFIFAPPLIKLITPGFSVEQLVKTVFLTRLMFLSPILLGLSAIFSGILQYFNRFLVYSFCPVLYNLGIILGIIFLSPSLGILGVTIGVILGAFFHFLIQVPSAISCGFKYQPIFNFQNFGIKKVFLLMLPRTFAAAGSQINLIVITAIASTLTAGSLSVFNLANNLQNLPVGIIGISFATAAFPVLSKSWAALNKEEFLQKLSSTFRQILYFVVPISFLMFILREKVVEIVLKHGQFSPGAAQLTSASLGLFSFGIFALALIPLLSRAFFSFQDTKTPTLIAILAMALNIALSFYFVRLFHFANVFSNFLMKNLSFLTNGEMSVLGLPLAFSIGAIFHFVLLMVFLYRRIGDFKLKEILTSFSKILIAGILMVIGVCLILYFVVSSAAVQTFWGIFWQTLLIGAAGFLIYIVATYFLNSPEIKTILRRFFHEKH